MKNHIKNYIKIMGLAAVPFGTAQAEDYEIRVSQEHKPDAEYFKISLAERRKEPKVVEVVWPHKKVLLEPIHDNPFYFVRVYTEELRRKEEVLMERGALGELFCGDLEANVVEWMGSYFLGNEDKFLMKKKAEWDLNDTVCKNALLAFKAGKNGGEAVRERQTEMRNQPKESFVSRPMCKLPDDCSYACYRFPGYSGYFFLVRDPRHLFSNSGYIFIIYGLRCDTLSVVSDVPTVLFWSSPGVSAVVYGSTNEIINGSGRGDIYKQLVGDQFVDFAHTVFRFVRQRSSANEEPLYKFCDVLCEACFEVESGRITKAWKYGERLNIDFGGCYFETLAQWVNFVFYEEDLERLGRFTYLAGKKRKEKQAEKLQNEIKIEEEGKKKNEKDPFGEK